MSNLGGLDEEKQVQENEETKVVDLDEEKKKRKPFHYWKVGNREYQLKLKAADVERLENKYKCNIMSLVNDIPPLAVMLTIIQSAMATWEHGIKYTDVLNIYDAYTEEGGNQMDLYMHVVLPTMVVSGFFTEEIAKGMMQAIENL